MPTPTWYLDVDGVVNSWPTPSPPVVRKHGPFEKATVDGALVHWSPVVVDGINAISRDGLADIVWLTTWGQASSTLLAPAIGLDGFGVAEASPGHVLGKVAAAGRGEHWWKWRLILSRHDQDASQFVWTDDEIDATFRKKALDQFGDRAFLVRTDSSPGLRAAQVDTIRSWLTGQADT